MQLFLCLTCAGGPINSSSCETQSKPFHTVAPNFMPFQPGTACQDDYMHEHRHSLFLVSARATTWWSSKSPKTGWTHKRTCTTANKFSLYNKLCLLKVTPNRRFYISFIFLNSFDSNSVFGVLETASGPAGVRVELGGLWGGTATASNQAWVWDPMH